MDNLTCIGCGHRCHLAHDPFCRECVNEQLATGGHVCKTCCCFECERDHYKEISPVYCENAPPRKWSFADVTDQMLLKVLQAPRKPVSVYFYTKGCDRCLDYQPVYEQAAQALGEKIRFYSADLWENPSLMHVFGLDEYDEGPVCYTFRRGNADIVSIYEFPISEIELAGRMHKDLGLRSRKK